MTKMTEDIPQFFSGESIRPDGSVVKYLMRMPQFGRFPADGNVAITLAEPDVTVSISLSPQTGMLGEPGNYLNYVAIIFSGHELSYEEVMTAAAEVVGILGFARLFEDLDTGTQMLIEHTHMKQTEQDKAAAIFSVGIIYGVPVTQEIMEQNSILDKLSGFTTRLLKRMEKANMPEVGDKVH
jgi:hypothetical protein